MTDLEKQLHQVRARIQAKLDNANLVHGAFRSDLEGACRYGLMLALNEIEWAISGSQEWVYIAVKIFDEYAETTLGVFSHLDDAMKCVALHPDFKGCEEEGYLSWRDGHSGFQIRTEHVIPRAGGDNDGSG